MIFARINSNQDVVGVYTVGVIDELLIQQLDEGEAFVPMSQSEFDSFNQGTNAKYIDGVLVVEPKNEIQPYTPSFEQVQFEHIRNLELYTSAFVYRKNGEVRYTKEKQSSFNALYVRCERMLRLQETPQVVKDVCEAKIALIESVYSWIESVLARHYVHLNALKTAETIEELDAVTWDYSDLNATDPDVWLEHVI